MSSPYTRNINHANENAKKEKTNEILASSDVILMPTTPGVAFAFNSVSDPVQMYLQDIFTVHANITGNPALSIPFATHQNGMPYGVQVMADRFCENKLFNFFNILSTLK